VEKSRQDWPSRNLPVTFTGAKGSEGRRRWRLLRATCKAIRASVSLRCADIFRTK